MLNVYLNAIDNRRQHEERAKGIYTGNSTQCKQKVLRVRAYNLKDTVSFYESVITHNSFDATTRHWALMLCHPCKSLLTPYIIRESS